MSAMPFDHAGWLICDGRLLDKQYYNNLYNIIGTAFGENEEGTHFRIPNGSGRVAAAIGSAGEGMNDWAMGDISGEEKHTLTIAEMPEHNHSGVTGNIGDHSHTNNSSTSLGLATSDGENTAGGGLDDTTGELNLYTTPKALTINGAGAHSHTISAQGGSQPHNNIQPTIYVGNMFIYGGF
jgi:microcystin-dependent protein